MAQSIADRNGLAVSLLLNTEKPQRMRLLKRLAQSTCMLTSPLELHQRGLTMSRQLNQHMHGQSASPGLQT